MYFERLNEQNVEHYIAYLKLAMTAGAGYDDGGRDR